MNPEMKILGKSLAQWMAEYPIMNKIAALEETAWINPARLPAEEAAARCPLTLADVLDASARLARFADYFNVSLDYLFGRTDNPEVNK